MGWWVGKETVCRVEERIAPEEWLYMDIVVSMYSPIVASIAEQEEVCECIELLKKSFGIGQQCRYTNANAKRRAKVKKRRVTKERQRKRQSEEWTCCLRFTLKPKGASVVSGWHYQRI